MQAFPRYDHKNFGIYPGKILLKRKSTKSPSQLHHCYLDNRNLFVDKNAVSSERVETKAKHAVIASMLVYFYVIDH